MQLMNFLILNSFMGNCNTTITKEEYCSQINNNIIPKKILSSFAKNENILTKYKINQKLLGRGGSGIVFLAKDENDNEYAIKSINKELISNYSQLITESEISLKVVHPNIIKLYDIYENDKTIFFVLECVKGGDLLQYLLNNSNNHLSNEESLLLIIQILETSYYLINKVKVIHRDLKPDNYLIVNENGQIKIKLIDFGFACYIPKDEKM